MHKTPTVNALSHTQDVSIYSKLTGTVDTEVSNSSAESLKVADKEIFDQYCGQVYTRKGMNDCRVHFVITKNLDAHRTVSTLHVHAILDGILSILHPMQAVEEFYIRTSHVREDTEMSLGFDGENISLSVPREGVELKSGWRIVPLYDPIVRFLLCILLYQIIIAELMLVTSVI